MHTWEDARRVVVGIGGEQWGMKELAEQALDEAQSYIRKGQDPVVVTWEVFLSLLDIYEETEKAFEEAIRKSPVYDYLASKIPAEDAMDVAQEVFIGLWNGLMNFVPTREDSWRGWQFMIAKRRMNNYLRDLYKLPEFVPIREEHIIDTTELIDTIEMEDTREVKVRRVCNRWIEGRDKRKAVFASQVLAILNGDLEYVGLTGLKMAARCGDISTSYLHRYFKQLIEEVRDEGL